ncbi:MAG: ROK family protein [Acidobacteriota bacterium]
MHKIMEMVKPKVIPPLDENFCPAVLWNHAFLDAIHSSGKGIPLLIGLERGDGSISVFETEVFPSGHGLASLNLFYIERLVKMLLWQKGGYKIIIGGPEEIGEHIKKVYSPSGERVFDLNLMSTVYKKDFSVEVTDPEKVPSPSEPSLPLGRHLDGCRIGFDLGASDRKVTSVVEGEPVFSEEVAWDPQNKKDPRYHYHEIMSALHRAAAHLPSVDAIGCSAAGIYINNRVMVASLFRGVPSNLFQKKVRNLFLDVQKWWKVPLEVVNDGEVAALAGSMTLNVNRVLGIAMGSSQAGGYVNENGNITGWLNELAFAPVDFNPKAPWDEWSGDYGCGVNYFSQQAVFRLAEVVGIILDKSQSPVERLRAVQELLKEKDTRAIKIFETIGCYLGYGIAHYADFYDFSHILILGRVASEEGGYIIVEKAKEVLKKEFPELESRIEIHLPDEWSRRVGQALAAASLAVIESK